MSDRDPYVDTCAAKYDQLYDAAEFVIARKQQYVVESSIDCTEAIHQADENIVTRTLIDIGNRARWLNDNGDTSEKLAYVDEVCSLMNKLIDGYAEAQAELDWERLEIV